MAERASLTSQLQRALVQAQARNSSSENTFLATPSLTSVTSRQSLTPSSEYGSQGSCPEDHGPQPPSESLAALEQQLLADGDGEQDRADMHDILAYQVVHNELAEMVGDVASQLGLSPGTAARPDVQMWLAEAAAASLPQDSLPKLQLHLQLEQQPPPGRFLSSELTLDDVKEMLLECAKAVAAEDVDTATRLVSDIRMLASPTGSTLQRLLHYMVEALVARLYGAGPDLYTTLRKGRCHSVFESPKAFEFLRRIHPNPRIAHLYANGVLLEAFQGASRVHVIDYGILNGQQWPSLMRALAERPEGPPRLRITGIEFPQPGQNPKRQVEETGKKLAAMADSLGIQFEFVGFADKWENVQISALEVRIDEVVAVCSMFRLRHLLDAFVVPSNPRRTVLDRICRMKPKVFVMGISNAALNVPLLTARIPEAVSHFNWYLEVMECSLAGFPLEREYLEQQLIARDIMNVIACEGFERRERAESYQQWHRRLVNAGFQMKPIKESRFLRAREMLQEYHENWSLKKDDGWMLHAWKGRPVEAIATWEPAPIPPKPHKRQSGW